MDAVRTALLVVICVLAIGGTALFFGATRAPLTPEEVAITGHWNGDADHDEQRSPNGIHVPSRVAPLVSVKRNGSENIFSREIARGALGPRTVPLSWIQ